MKAQRRSRKFRAKDAFQGQVGEAAIVLTSALPTRAGRYLINADCQIVTLNVRIRACHKMLLSTGNGRTEDGRLPAPLRHKEPLAAGPIADI